MHDGTTKLIRDIEIGDMVIGTEEQVERYHQFSVFPTKVLQLHNRKVEELLVITFEDGKTIKITPNHRVLNGRHKWTESGNLQQGTGIVMSANLWHENDTPDIINDINYIKGYFLAMWLTDGSFNYYQYDSGDIYSLRLAVKDTEIIQRMKEYCEQLNFDYKIRPFKISEKDDLTVDAIFSGKKDSYNYIVNLLDDVKNNQEVYLRNIKFLKGFLAACYDAEGHIDKDGYVLSISNSDDFILDTWESGLKQLGFSTKRDPESTYVNKPVYRSRLVTEKLQKSTGELQTKFFNLCQPAVKRKCFSAFYNSSPLYRNKIIKIEKLKGEFEVFNIGTESHTYLANGLAVHNCFVQQKPHFMDFQTAKDGIDFLVRNQEKKLIKHPAAKKEKVSVTFFGGEPTLLWDDIIVPLVQYTEEKYPNIVNFGITTNGTLLNEDRIKWLYNHNIRPLLSIDGAKETQDFNRPCRDGRSSFDLMSKNIPIILKYFPNTTFRATIYEPTVKYLYENYLFAIKNGFRNIFLCPNARDSWSDEGLATLHEEINKIFTYNILSFMEGVNPIQCSNIDDAFLSILNHDRQIHSGKKWNLAPERNVVRCGLGTGSISIAYDGKLFGCQEQDSRDTNDYFYIGDIYNGINEERHRIILNDYNKAEMITCEDSSLCDTCIRRLSCIHETCPSVSHDMFNNFFIRPKVDCLYAQWLQENAITMMDFLVNQEQNETFKLYLEKCYQGQR